MSVGRDNTEELISLALDERIKYQEGRVLRRARTLIPYLTIEDIKNSDDFPPLCADPEFNYELGTLEGYIGARLAFASTVRKS